MPDYVVDGCYVLCVGIGAGVGGGCHDLGRLIQLGVCAVDFLDETGWDVYCGCVEWT